MSKGKPHTLIQFWVSAHWRTSAPSIFGKYGDPKECPEGSAVSKFRTRTRFSEFGRVKMRNVYIGFDGALTGVEFICTAVGGTNKGKATKTLIFDIKEGTG